MGSTCENSDLVDSGTSRNNILTRSCVLVCTAYALTRREYKRSLFRRPNIDEGLVKQISPVEARLRCMTDIVRGHRAYFLEGIFATGSPKLECFQLGGSS